MDLIPKLSYEEIRKAQKVENRMRARNIQMRENNIIQLDHRSNPPDMHDAGFMCVQAGHGRKASLIPDYPSRNNRN